MDAGIQPIWLQHHAVSRNWPVVETSLPIITSLEPLLNLQNVLNERKENLTPEDRTV
jgi:hypothetical protein